MALKLHTEFTKTTKNFWDDVIFGQFSRYEKNTIKHFID